MIVYPRQAATRTVASAFPRTVLPSQRILHFTCLRQASSTDPTLSPSSQLKFPSEGYEKIFDVNLPEGRCVGLRIGQLGRSSSLQHGSHAVEHETDKGVAISNTTLFAPWIHEYLHPDEVRYASQLKSDASQKSFIGGRLALRQAMECQIQDCIILKDAHGRPTLPPSFLGSISHKGNVAVALVATATTATQEAGWAIGVDLEVRQKGHKRIARRILTEHENRNLGLLASIDADEEVLLRFSIKEAIYKAMHPLICQFVGFQEVETQPLADGTVQVILNLTSGAHRDFDSVTANWKVLDDYFLTSASVRLKPCIRAKRNNNNPEDCRIR